MRRLRPIFMHWIVAFSVALAFFSCKPVAAQGERHTSQESLYAGEDGLKFGGYANAVYRRLPNSNKEVSLDELSMIVRWDGNSRFRFFGEFEIERPFVWQEGQDFSNRDSKLDLERLYVDYNLSDKINLRGGRFLTPAGRWNLIHAAPLVWTTLRPLATSRLFPTSVNGAMLYGAMPVGDRAFEYTIYHEAIKDQESDRDELEFKDVRGARFNLTGKVNWGVSLAEFTESIPGTPKYRMLGLDFMTKQNDWEFSGELFQRYTTSNGDGGSGGYLQAVAPLGNQWYGIGRLENFKRPAEGSTERWVLGTAWRMTPKRVLKMEYVGGDENRVDSPKGFQASFAILF
jgi:hypothetical protein